MSAWRRQYPNRNIGRILHFLYHYCGPEVAERATVGIDQVSYQGEIIAIYEFLGDSNIPFFVFVAKQAADKVATWERNQKENWSHAVRDAGNVIQEVYSDFKNDKKTIKETDNA